MKYLFATTYLPLADRFHNLYSYNFFKPSPGGISFLSLPQKRNQKNASQRKISSLLSSLLLDYSLCSFLSSTDSPSKDRLVSLPLPWGWTSDKVALARITSSREPLVYQFSRKLVFVNENYVISKKLLFFELTSWKKKIERR